MEQIKRPPQKIIFSITGGDYLRDSSGTSKVVKAHEGIFTQAGYDYAVMFPISLSRGAGAKRKTITTGCYGLALNGNFLGVYTKNQILKWLNNRQNEGKVISGILIHHVIRSRISEIRYIVERIEHVKVVYYLHDFYTCCPNYNLLKNDRESCIGNMDMCQGCSYEPLREKHMQEIAELFRSFGKRVQFVAPSMYVLDQWLKYYPQYADKESIIPHQKSEGQYMGNRTNILPAPKIRIGYVGAQTKPKGWEIWKDILNKLPKSRESYDFYYFGNGLEEIEGMTKVCVEIHRQGEDAMINALRDHQIAIVFLGSVCGETYSYTLYEAHAANCYVLTMETGGNIADTVQRESWGKVFQTGADIIAFLENKLSVIEALSEWRRASKPGAMRYHDNDDVAALFDGGNYAEVNVTYLSNEMVSIPLRHVLSQVYRRVYESRK